MGKTRSPGPTNPLSRAGFYRDSVSGGTVPRSVLDVERAERRLRTRLHELELDDVDKQLSPAEIILLAAMWHVDLEPEPQAVVGPYRVDFLFPTEHVAIEVDGKEWHGPDRWQADRKRQRYLRDTHDLVVRRFTGSEVYRNPILVARSIKFTVEWIHDRLDLIAKAAS